MDFLFLSEHAHIDFSSFSEVSLLSLILTYSTCHMPGLAVYWVNTYSLGVLLLYVLHVIYFASGLLVLVTEKSNAIWAVSLIWIFRDLMWIWIYTCALFWVVRKSWYGWYSEVCAFNVNYPKLCIIFVHINLVNLVGVLFFSSMTVHPDAFIQNCIAFLPAVSAVLPAFQCTSRLKLQLLKTWVCFVFHWLLSEPLRSLQHLWQVFWPSGVSWRSCFIFSFFKFELLWPNSSSLYLSIASFLKNWLGVKDEGFPGLQLQLQTCDSDHLNKSKLRY